MSWVRCSGCFGERHRLEVRCDGGISMLECGACKGWGIVDKDTSLPPEPNPAFLSLCPSCNCMTHTLMDDTCGKCKRGKK